jgi:hypothetical protein
MHTAEEYRQYAQECMEGARIATSDAVRMQFIELAKLWLTAAIQAERRGNGKTTWPTRVDDTTSLEPSD